MSDPPFPSIELQDLSVDRGSTRILNRISLYLRGGELVALLGPSGCGKSTLLKALTGMLKPSAGKVILKGKPFHDGEREPGSVGYVPQDDIVHTALKVRSALDYAALLRLPADMPDPSRKARVEGVLKTLSLTEHQGKRVSQLSGGQRKRVSVGVELLTDPTVLLMDEPTSGLDPALEEQLMKSMRTLTGPERITILSTHAMSSLEVCDLVILLLKGHLVFLGPPKAALKHFSTGDFGSIFKQLAAQRVTEFTGAWERSPWRTRVLSPTRQPGRELAA